MIKTYNTRFGNVVLTIPEDMQCATAIASGGIDSTLLLYLLLENGVIPEVIFMKNANSKLEALYDCVEWLNKKFFVSLDVKLHERTTEGHYLRPEIQSIASSVQYLYTGVTALPEIDIGGLPPNRPKLNKTVNGNTIMPFVMLDKRAVVQLYKDLALEELFSKTYSCAVRTDEPCGTCFQCYEKDWALKEVYDN